MNEWGIEIEGLDKLKREFLNLASESQIEIVNRKVLKECGEEALKKVEPLIHKSKDNSKSGRKGSRPSGHAADNIPEPKIKKKKGNLQCIVGWEKEDNTPYYYMKMEEWGTSQRPPHHSFGLVNKMLFKKYEKITKKYYNQAVKVLEE